MLKDLQYSSTQFVASEQLHKYGPNVHLLNDPVAARLLARFCEPSTLQPELSRLTRRLTQILCAAAVNQLFVRKPTQVKTRMAASHPEAAFEQDLIAEARSVVVVDLMRAGILPAEVCYELLHDVTAPEKIRQDHLLINRKTNEQGEVIGTQISGYKIGGATRGAVVMIPDPMGATGGTIKSTVELYESRDTQAKISGAAPLYIALHFMITPEYLKLISAVKPQVQVFALRLDRGMSPAEVLKKIPGEDWSREKGLNERDYIVPGAGGIGELLNNSFES